jgi:hypothetical protein
LAAMRIDKYEFRTRRAKTQNSAASGPAGTNKANILQASRPAETATEISSRPGTAAGNKTNGVRARRNV